MITHPIPHTWVGRFAVQLSQPGVVNGRLSGPPASGYNESVWIIITLCLVVISACSPPPNAPAEPKNLVILSIDTLRADHLGLYGYRRPTSPHLDRFARSSVVFDQAVTVHVATAPAHGTILTGEYPGSHGIERNGMTLKKGIPTLAGIFAEKGLATGAFVSGWTLQRHTGLDRGFEIYDDDLGPPRNGARRDGSETTAAAVTWIREQVAAEKDFFLFVHLFEPHWPYDPPARDALRFLPGVYELTTVSKPVHLDRLLSVNRLTLAEQQEYVARYDGEIVVADRLADRLFDELERLGVAHNTVVIVLSDHGETLFEREWTMDHGTRPYEEQTRVPLVLHIPGDPYAGHRVPDQVSLVDVVPTALEIFGLESPRSLPGRSLLPLIRGERTDEQPRPAFITARAEPRRVPHIDAPLLSRGLVRAIRLPGIKLIEYPMAGQLRQPELFNLIDDPGERNNRAKTSFDIVVGLHNELEKWQSATGQAPEPGSRELDPEVEEALRELGYIDD
jgi:choline-sulfatase